MSYDYTLNCVNCGKQNIIFEDDPFDVKCEFGDHPVRIKKKEGNMVVTINAKELYPETREKLGIGKTIAEVRTLEDSPPVPPRPDLTGLNLTKRNWVMHKYYEANAPAILADRAALGDKEACRRWGFSECGYKNFLKRRGLIFEKGIAGPRKYKKRAASADKKAPTIDKAAPAAALKAEAEEILKKAADALKPKSPAGEKEEPLKLPPDMVDINAPKLVIFKLPDFPAFKWYWWPGVQKKWLETYARLAGK
jgi:hypothetical protein